MTKVKSLYYVKIASCWIFSKTWWVGSFDSQQAAVEWRTKFEDMQIGVVDIQLKYDALEIYPKTKAKRLWLHKEAVISPDQALTLIGNKS